MRVTDWRPWLPRWLALRLALAAAVAVATVITAWTPAAALDCEGVVLDNGCLFTITGSDTPDPDDGYAVTNADGVPFYDFVRAREVQSIGYPISQRWISGTFTFQAFQKVILQWDPGRGRVNYYNTLDVLANRYPEVELPNVPPHQVLETDANADFAGALRTHLALLDRNAAIKERFLSEPAWLSLYGLPIRYEERKVDGNPQGLQLLRTQRTVFEIWNVAAPGTTVGRVNLQNVPDKLKKLDNVIIPNTAKGLRTASDPDSSAIIAKLLWVVDGITPLEEHAVGYLERIFAASEPLVRTLTQDTSGWTLKVEPREAHLRELEALAHVAELAWARDELDSTEERLVNAIRFYADVVPDLVTLIPQKPWIKDGLSDEEVDIVEDLLALGFDERLILNETNPGTNEATIPYYLLQMPFLDSIEPFDAPAVRGLREIGWHDRNSLHTIVSRYAEDGGITDDRAKIISVLPYVVSNKPELLNPMLNPSAVSVEERSIVLPHTGPVILAVIRTQPGDERTMAYLDEAVRFSEGFIRRPFPTSYIALHVTEAVEPWGGLFLGSHIAIREGYDDQYHYFNDSLRGVLYHEVAHYYWNACPSWLCEGAAVYFEMHAGVLGSGAQKGIAEACSTTSIIDVASEWNECDYYLGAALFFNLFHSLGEGVFLRGLWRLYDTSQGNLSPGSCEGVEIGLCHLRFAFVTDAPPEAAALAERFLRELYFGEG